MIYKNTVFILFISILLTACDNKSNQQEVMTVKASDIVKKRVDMNGMNCVGCETRVEKSIVKMEGVVAFKVVAEDNSAMLEFDKSKTNFNTINKELSKMGDKTCL